jgi:Na+/H+ antiporter NhaC
METAPNQTKTALTSTIFKVLITAFALLLLASFVYYVYHFATRNELNELTDEEQEASKGRLAAFGFLGAIAVVAVIALGIALWKAGKGESDFL